MPWLAPVTIATEFDMSILLDAKAQVSTNQLDVEPTGGCVFRDL